MNRKMFGVFKGAHCKYTVKIYEAKLHDLENIYLQAL